jgi:hypothetical protein
MLGLFGLLLFLFPAVGGLLVLLAVRSNRREIRAFVHGTPTLARVVYAGDDLSTTVNGRHPYKVAWEFRVEGDVYEGSLTSMKLLELEPFGKAREVAVLYDPADPSCNTLYVE